MRPILAASALSLLFAMFPFATAVEAGTTPACPYTAAELSAVVGVPVEAGTGQETSDSGGPRLYCYYAAGSVSIQLYQYVRHAPLSPTERRRLFSGQAIANDPDSATWLENAEGSTFIALGYFRHSTKIELVIDGFDLQQEAVTKPVKERLLKLRRVP